MADPQTRQELNDAELAVRVMRAIAAGVRYDMLFLPPAFTVDEARVDAIEALARTEGIVPDLHDDDDIDNPGGSVPAP